MMFVPIESSERLTWCELLEELLFKEDVDKFIDGHLGILVIRHRRVPQVTDLVLSLLIHTWGRMDSFHVADVVRSHW